MNWKWIIAGALWAVAVIAGMRAMLNYENAPATPGRPPQQWPSQSKAPRRQGLPTIVVIAHPHCPCTRATIGELSLLMTRLQGKATATVIFDRPKGLPNSWEQTDLCRSAAAIPGVTVMLDIGSVETDLFQANASGQTMLYDAGGQLLFSGGITASRGHSGDNIGRSSIISLVTTGKAIRTHTSVFGCSLHNSTSKAEMEDSPWKTQTRSQ